MGTSLIQRSRVWVETTNPVDRAEIFGRLDGVCDAICVVTTSATLDIAIERLRQLEERYTAQYEGRRPEPS